KLLGLVQEQGPIMWLFRTRRDESPRWAVAARMTQLTAETEDAPHQSSRGPHADGRSRRRTHHETGLDDR
ncbi:MAG: hypothetical protein AB1601_01110, partial [Planctomycetota bacterium]